MSRNSLLSKYKGAHEKYMKKILSAIFSGPYKDILAFKGGTLAYFYYELPRFSTDLDIDLLDIDQEQQVIDYFNEVLVTIGNVEEPMLGKGIHRWKFHYEREAWNIKVELNKRRSKYTEYEWIQIGDIKVQAQTVESMVTNKLLALGDRRYNRDLYDIHYFLSKEYTFSESIIVDRTDKTLQEWITMIIQEIPERFQSNTVLHQLGEVLGKGQKPRVKNHLVDETVAFLESYMKNNS